MKRILLLLFVFLLSYSNILFAQHLKKNGTPNMGFKENKANYSPSTPINFLEVQLLQHISEGILQIGIIHLLSWFGIFCSINNIPFDAKKT